MRALRKIGTYGCVLLLCGCAAGQMQTRTDLDLEEMKRRLATLERTVQALKGAEGASERLDSLGRNQAELRADLDAMRVDFQSLSGQLEERSYAMSDLRSQIDLLQDEYGLKVAALEERLDRLENRMTQSVTKVPSKETEVEPAPDPGPRKEAADPSEAEPLYKKALEKVQQSDDYAGAISLFQEFLRKFPEHDLAVNAYYWIGESFYGLQDFEKAIVQFQDVIQKFPQHGKAPAALLKQALAFQAMNDPKSAEVILKKLIEIYPESESAKKARVRLKALGG